MQGGTLVKISKVISAEFPYFKPKKTDEKLKESIKFLKWEISAEDYISFVRFSSLISFLISLLLLTLMFLANYFSIVLVSVLLTLPSLVYYILIEYPNNKAHLVRINSLSYVPTIFTQLIVYLKQNPNLEKAVQFVTAHGENLMIKDLKKALTESYLGLKRNIKSALIEIGEKWSKNFSEFKRSIYLLTSAVSEKDEEKRNKTLDRSIEVLLDGILSKIREYTSDLYIPTLFLFSFGTVLPLVIISLLPILSFLGNEFSSPLQMTTLLAISLVAIYIYSNKIIMKRPPTLSSISLPSDLEGFPEEGKMKLRILGNEIEVNKYFYPVAIFLLFSFPGFLHLISYIDWLDFKFNLIEGYNTIFIIWGLTMAISLYCYGTSWYKKEYRDKTEKLEEEAIDGFYQIAGRLDEGHSPEVAIKQVSESMKDSEFGNFLKTISKEVKVTHTTLDKVILQNLRKIYSENVRVMFEIFTNSLKKGIITTSKILITMVNHFEGLKKTEEKLKEMLKNTISMMSTTATIFAPMITGLVVTLQKIVEEGLKEAQVSMENNILMGSNLTFFVAPSINIEILQLIAGVYMLLLAILLIRYSVMLGHGKDEVILKYEIASKLPIASFIFTLTLIFSRLILS